MKIEKVSNGLVSGYETKASEKKEDQKKIAVGVGSAVSSFENISKAQTDLSKVAGSNASSEQKGSKDITLDQSQLAGNVNLDRVPTDTDNKDGRTRYEDSKANNPFNKGREDSSDRITDRQNAATDRSGSTGPDISTKVDQVISCDFTLPENRYSEYGGGQPSRADMRKGASGQDLMDAASQSDQSPKKPGKEGLQDGASLGERADQAFGGAVKVMHGWADENPAEVYEGFSQLDKATGGVAGDLAAVVIPGAG